MNFLRESRKNRLHILKGCLPLLIYKIEFFKWVSAKGVIDFLFITLEYVEAQRAIYIEYL